MKTSLLFVRVFSLSLLITCINKIAVGQSSNPPTLHDLEIKFPEALYYKLPRLHARQSLIDAMPSDTPAQTQKKNEEQNKLNRKIGYLYRFAMSSINLKDTAVVLFVGNGNIQKTFTEGASVPTSTGLGVNYSEQWKRPKFIDFYKIELDGFINVSSNVDTIRSKIDKTSSKLTNASEFGGSILTPLNSGQAYSISFRGYFVTLKLGIISGVYARYAAANRFWNYDGQSLPSTLGSFRAGVFYEFLRPDLRDNCSISLGTGFVYNSIRGDVALPINESFRSSILGENKTNFYGYEFNTLFRLKNIKAEFSYTHFSGTDNIPGLSGGRLVTTISFVGGFPLKLN